VHKFASAGHRVLVEAGPGEASSISDEMWEEAGLRGGITLAAASMAIRDAVRSIDLLIDAVLVVRSRPPPWLIARRSGV
jgi:alanine dehydrogenase